MAVYTVQLSVILLPSTTELADALRAAGDRHHAVVQLEANALLLHAVDSKSIALVQAAAGWRRALQAP
jgi:hypothetical protein